MLRRRGLLAGAVAGLATRRALGAPRNAAWPTALTMGTGSLGGTYPLYGAAWGKIVAEATGVNMLYRASNGPNEDIILLDRGSIDLAMTTLGVAHQAWTGGGAWTGGVRFRTIRAMFPMYESAFHGAAAAKSGITSASGLAGKLVGIGPESGTGGTYIPRMLRILGVAVRAFRFGNFAALSDMLLAGKLDACLFAAGPPIPAFVHVAKYMQVQFFGFARREVALLVRELPELSATHISAATYAGQRERFPCPGMFNFAICRQALQESLVYAVTEAALAGARTMAATLPLAAETVAGNIDQDRFLPFHPGAARYYRRHGFSVPGRLVME